MNDCVVIPSLPDWSTPVRWNRSRKVSIASGVNGGEDRAVSQTKALQRLSYVTAAVSTDDTNRLIARILAGLKSGAVAIPFWGRAQYPLAPDGTKLLRVEQVQTCGLWRFSVGDYVFFIRPDREGNVWRDIQNTLKINIGGGAVDDWLEDSFITDGESESTVAVLDYSALIGFPPGPDAIYLDGQFYDGPDSGAELVYDIGGLVPGIDCQVRLHMVENASEFTGVGVDRRKFRVNVTGVAVESRLVEPWESAGGVHKPVGIDFIAAPNSSGHIKVEIKCDYVQAVGLVDYAQDMTVPIAGGTGFAVTNGDIVYFTAQTDPSQNGPWVCSTGLPHYVRPPGASLSAELTGRTFYILGGAYAGQYWRCTNTLPFVVGVDALTSAFAAVAFHLALHGIEVRQFTWETKQLTNATGPNLGWLGWLSGVYSDSHALYPMLFGRLSIDRLATITDRAGSVTLTVQEPPGIGQLGIPGSCPVEICDDEDDLAFHDQTDFPINTCGFGIPQYWQSNYVWGFNASDDPNLVLTDAQRACHRALAQLEWAAFVAGGGGAIHQNGSPFWGWTSITDTYKSMEAKHAAGSCNPTDGIGDTSFLFGGYTTIWIPYCLGS